MRSPAKIIAFVGPSCPRDFLVARYPDMLLLGPARRGDVEAAANSYPAAIAIVDGLLVENMPPSPMEVFDASQKVPVYGAASLGAMRAAELHGHGVRGIGWVYLQYLNGKVVADDEVVTPCDPTTFAALGVPLIRIRYALEMLVESAAIEPEAANDVLQAYKRVHFADRTEATISECAKRVCCSANIIRALTHERFDIKRLDTLRCLDAIQCSGNDEHRRF